MARSAKFGAGVGGEIPLGGLPQEIFEILRPNGCILGHFWSIWLLVLTVMIEALVTLKHVNLGVVLFIIFFFGQFIF